MLDQIADTARERGLTEREVVEDVMLGQARTERLMEPIEVANLFAFGFSRHVDFGALPDRCEREVPTLVVGTVDVNGGERRFGIDRTTACGRAGNRLQQSL